MKKSFFTILLACWSIMATAQTIGPVRINLSDSTYHAQLRGKSGTRTSAQIVQGTWNGASSIRSFEFSVTTTGRYDLYIDPAGGSSYVKQSTWGKTNGKMVMGTDLGTILEKANGNLEWLSIALGDTSVSTEIIKALAVTNPKIGPLAVDSTKIAACQVPGSKIKLETIESKHIKNGTLATVDYGDSTLSKAKLTKALIDYIDASGGGTITNYPNDLDIEDSGGELGLKDGGTAWGKLNTDLKYRITRGVIYSGDYGVSPDSSGDDNRINLQLAINAAVTAKATLMLPIGETTINYTSASPHLDITGDLTIRGYGPETVLVITPARTDSSFNLDVFYTTDGTASTRGSSLTLEKFSIEGPTDVGGLYLGSLARTQVINTGNYTGNIKFDGINITNAFQCVITFRRTPTVGSSLDVIDCDWQAYSDGVYARNETGNTMNINIINSRFTITSYESGGIWYGTALYLDPNADILVDGCTFYDHRGRVVIQFYSSTGSVAGTPNYQIVRNSTFLNFDGTAIVLGRVIPGEVNNCTFIAGVGHSTTLGINTERLGVNISNCTITAYQGIATSGCADSLNQNNFIVNNTTIYPSWLGITAAGSLKFYLNNIRIFCNDSANYGINIGHVDTVNAVWYINDVYVGSYKIAGINTESNGKGEIYIKNSVFDDPDQPGIIFGGGTSKGEVNYCEFRNATGYAILASAEDSSGVIRGKGNDFGAGSISLHAGNYQSFTPKSGTNPAIAASWVTTSINYDTEIDTSISSQTVGNIRLLDGIYSFICDTTCIFATNSTQVTKHDGKRTKGEIVQFRADQKAGKWYEIGQMINTLGTNALTVASDSTVAVDASLGGIFTLTASKDTVTISAPTWPVVGQEITFSILQDATGGRAVAWNTVFKSGWVDTGNTSNKRSAISFYYNGTNWIQSRGQTTYY